LDAAAPATNLGGALPTTGARRVPVVFEAARRSNGPLPVRADLLPLFRGSDARSWVPERSLAYDIALIPLPDLGPAGHARSSAGGINSKLEYRNPKQFERSKTGNYRKGNCFEFPPALNMILVPKLHLGTHPARFDIRIPNIRQKSSTFVIRRSSLVQHEHHENFEKHSSDSLAGSFDRLPDLRRSAARRGR